MIVTSRFRTYSVDHIDSFSRFLFGYVKPFAQKTALVDPDSGGSIRFSDLQQAVEQCSRKLVSLGIRKGDVVGIVCGNSIEVIVLSLAVCHIGAVFAPLNPAYKLDEIVKYVNQLSAKWIFADSGYITKVHVCRARFYHTQAVFDLERFLHDQFLDRGPTGHDFSNSDTAMIFFSSGTTGLPKGVCLSHRALVAHIHVTSSAKSDPSTPMPRIAPEDRVYGVLPYFHAGGLLTVYCMLSQGATVYVNKIFREQQFLSVIYEHQITVINIVPPIVSALLPGAQKLNSLRLILIGASQVSQDLLMNVRRRLPNAAVIELYGLTEVGILTLMSPLRSKPHTIGVLMPGFECKLLDGELCFRSATAMNGYLDPEQTREAFAGDGDGWIRSGDLGNVDEEGYFSITGRLKELIKVRGWQVSPKELEDAVCSAFPDHVHECCVIGVADERSGELPKAFIVLKANAIITEEEIHRMINERFISYKHLKGGIQFVDSIPKNPSGKTDRRRLAQEYNQPTNAGRSA